MKKYGPILLAALGLVFLSWRLPYLLASGSSSGSDVGEQAHIGKPAESPKAGAVATFASGCFWCVEAIYESVNGVTEAVSGYAGGWTDGPTYREVSSGGTGHAEAVQVYYDPDVVSYAELVDVYFGSQNPTQVNGQGPDHGSAYRSIIFIRTDEEKKTAERAKAAVAASGEYNRPIAAKIQPIKMFWEAEEYHQDFERRNPRHAYVRNVSIPRLKRFQAKFPKLLKKTDRD